MITERYFVAINPKGWIVWDRGKNEMVGEPFTTRKKPDAVRKCRELNAQVRARHG